MDSQRVDRLLIVVDNRVCDEWAGRIRTVWGFSALVTVGSDSLLFDTGPDPEVLRENLDALGVDLSSLRYVVISHNHGDHIGGLSAVVRPGIKVIVPERLMNEEYERVVRVANAELIMNESQEPIDLLPSVFLLPPLVSRRTYEGIREQALILSDFPGKGGDTLLTGCSHPGLDVIVRHAISHGFKPTLIVGGSHLRMLDEDVAGLIDRLSGLGVQRLGLSHCTSSEVISTIKDKGMHLEAYAGCEIRRE